MKVITREIKIYKYTFGKYDAATGKVNDIHVIERAKPLTRGESKAISEERNGAMMVDHEVVPTRYTLPVEEYMAACRSYADRVAAGQAEPIPVDATETENDADEGEEEV